MKIFEKWKEKEKVNLKKKEKKKVSSKFHGISSSLVMITTNKRLKPLIFSIKSKLIKTKDEKKIFFFNQ